MKKPLLVALTSLSLFAAAQAGMTKEEQQAKEKQKEEEKAQAVKAREAVKEVLVAKDANHDGTLTKDEYLTGESNAEEAGAKFDKFNKNKDRSLSKKEIEASLGF